MSISSEEASFALEICDLNDPGKNCHQCPMRDKRWDGAWEDGETDCVHELMRISAKLLKPKTGKWIKSGRWGRVYKCNQCGNFLDFDGVNAGRGDANYCPNCRARMEVR